MSKVTFEVEGIKITVEKEDQGMFGHLGGYRQEDHFYRRDPRPSNHFAHRPYYQRGEESADDVRSPYQTNFYPSQEDWRYAVNHQYGKQSTSEPMFDESVFSALRATANKAAEFANKVDRGDHHCETRLQLDAAESDYENLDDNTNRVKRPNQFMPAMVGVDSVEVGIAALAENNDEHFHLLGAYDKIKQAIATFIGKYIFSGEAVDLPFTQTDRGDYALLLPVPYLSMDILLYVDMVEVDGKHYVISINFDYQADIEGEDEGTPVEQSAKGYILSTLKSYIEHRRARHRQVTTQQPSTNPEAEGQTDGNSQVTSEAPATQQKNKF